MSSISGPSDSTSEGRGRRNRLLLSLGIATAIQGAVVGTHALLDPATTPTVHRLTTLLGGDFFGGGYIQFLTLVAFFWGVLDVRHMRRLVQMESGYLSTDLLPREPHVVLGPEDVNRIRIRVQEFLDARPPESPGVRRLLYELVRKACVKFRANESAEAAFQIVESQSRIDRERSDTLFSPLRYLLWAIPSIGFVGTVLGISGALAIADSEDIAVITRTLGVAFDTTLLALLLSLVLMYLFHDLQSRMDRLHQDVESSVIEHLINRIDVE